MKLASFNREINLDWLWPRSCILLSPRYLSFGLLFGRYGACHRKSREIDLSYNVGRLLRFEKRHFPKYTVAFLAEYICDLFISDWR